MTKRIEAQSNGGQIPPLQPFGRFCKSLGISAVTGWRWRKAGFFKVVVIANRPYVSGSAVAELVRRAEGGELAKVKV